VAVEIKPRHEDPGYSLRRYYIDRFLASTVGQQKGSGLLLDIGGNKVQKRGQFDYSCCDMNVIYANLKADKQPDVQADAAALPFADNCFDIVVCAELLEHVYSPENVLAEVFRVLKKGGLLLITVPFLVQIHADPADYGRHTDAYWERCLAETGFGGIEIERQGDFRCVVVDMLTAYIQHKAQAGRLNPITHHFFNWCLARARKKALKPEGCIENTLSAFCRSFTTGFGINCRK
jgi:SAM-dependent methyltransferase